jgi:hypothetical protein
MTITVNKFNGDIVKVVNDFKKEIIAGLEILGFGYPNYAEDIAKNFVRLAENFSGAIRPYNPQLGQLWMDTSSGRVLRVCTRQATTLDEVNYTTTNDGSQWTALFAIDPTGNRATILYNGSPVYPDTSATANTLVVRGANGKIDVSSLPDSIAAGSAQTAQRLNPGAKINGTTFTGAADISINADAIPETASRKFWNTYNITVDTNNTSQLNYDPTTGKIIYRAPVMPASGVTAFNGRAGSVSLAKLDVTNALGFTPLNENGGNVQSLSIVNGNYALFVQNGNPLISFNPNCYYAYDRTTGNHILATNGQAVFQAGLTNDNLYHNSNRIWNAGYQGAGSGMDSDLLDGQHGSYYLDLGNATGSIPTSAIITQANYGSSGYVVYRGGFCVQWGQYRASVTSEYTVGVTYPIAFDNPALSFSATTFLDYWTNQSDIWVQKVGQGSATGVTVGFQAARTDDRRASGFDWVAFGTVGQGSSTPVATPTPTPTPGGGGGGGGGGGCVWVESILPSGQVANDVVIGSDLLLLNRDGTDGYHHEPVERVYKEFQPCYRIHTESGITLVASDSTPITNKEGPTVWLLDSLGLSVPVLDKGEFRWEKIVQLEPLGDLEVVLISAGNGTYAAGEHRDNRYIFTHNAVPTTPVAK